jgi:hypothetical protein
MIIPSSWASKVFAVCYKAKGARNLAGFVT